MSDNKPEALLKGALEKIVYFEARATQLHNDLAHMRAENEHCKNKLAQAAQREIELRREIAELEVKTQHERAARDEASRFMDALRFERVDLIGKMLDAILIQNDSEELERFDLAQFISQLRGEVLKSRLSAAETPSPPAISPEEKPVTQAAETPVLSLASQLASQGRLSVTEQELQTLSHPHSSVRRNNETLFDLSVRELSAPNSAIRIRAAERLQALAHPAAAPTLVASLHNETQPSVQVAYINAFASLAHAEGVPVVQSFLTSPSVDVRIAALKAFLKLDSAQAGPYLSAALKDSNKLVRRRACLLALSLPGDQALTLASQAMQDVDPEVRVLATLVFGATQTEATQEQLLRALHDEDIRVRRSASQMLSHAFGCDLTPLANLDVLQRRREVRRLLHLQRPTGAPVLASPPEADEQRFAGPSPELCSGIVRELRAAIRGQPMADLARALGASLHDTMRACTALMQQGQVVRRGLKYFVA